MHDLALEEEVLDAPAIPRPRRALARCITASVLALLAIHALLLCSAWLWVGEMLEDLQWHLGLLSLAAALCLFLAKRHLLALGVLFLAGIDLSGEAHLYFPVSREEENSPALVLATANVLFSNDQREALAEALRESGAAVIALQELSLPLRGHLEQALADYPYRAFSPASVWHADTWGLGLFSRLPFAATRTIDLDACYAPAIEARIATPFGDLRVRVAHVNRPGSGWRCEMRRRGLRALERLEWQPHDVLLGDLNTTPSSSLFAHLLEATGLRDSMPGFGRQTSYWKYRSLPRALGVAIDHALVGDHLLVRDRRIFELPGSDHAGVRVELSSSEGR